MKITVWHPRMPSQPTDDEADSLAQAVSVAQALEEMEVDVDLLAFDLRDLPGSIHALAAGRPDLVFNLVEETGGNKSLNYLPAQILEALDIAFTGNLAEAMALTTHKVATKALLRQHSLPTPEWIYGDRVSVTDGDDPFLLKPVSADASQGILESDLQLHQGTEAALQALRRLTCSNGSANRWFAERYVDGREFNVSLIEVGGAPLVLPIAEMCFLDYPRDKPRIVGYRAKWQPDSFEYSHTCRRFDLPPEDDALLHSLRDLSLECWQLFHLRGYARVDFRVDLAGQPWILEINTNPGIAPDAGLPAAAAAARLSYRHLVGRIAESAKGDRGPHEQPRG